MSNDVPDRIDHMEKMAVAAAKMYNLLWDSCADGDEMLMVVALVLRMIYQSTSAEQRQSFREFIEEFCEWASEVRPLPATGEH